ncbi:MAG TPA: glycosyltransferase family 4 protein [Alphaproteobacteria bacterium]|nr:glycosyltransferase family 4 protein [Alphaproteobacteria bacterium]
MSKLKVLMFGWEFPPFMSGGLGTACYGLTKGLTNKNVEVTFVIPHGPDDMRTEYVKLLIASNTNLSKYNFKVKHVETLLAPYQSEAQYQKEYDQYVQSLKNSKTSSGGGAKLLYGKNIYDEVYRFSLAARDIALTEEFDIIHCHDWMTFPAGIEAKRATGKPLVVHVHATEFDRTGGNSVNDYISHIEYEGMANADRVVAVSYYTKQKIMQHYSIPAEKITVIHNAVDFGEEKKYDIKKHEKVVLFLGRLTLQKGPDYFVEAAKRVLDYDPDVKFIIAGSGDMEARLIDRVAQLGIGHKVLFAGFISGEEVNKAYQAADLYVMPSVSEPFGITPLEALRNGVPVIISKQSGVGEVLKNALKVDFWDIDELANKMISVLNYRNLHHELSKHGSIEVHSFSWNVPAQKCIDVYHEVLVDHHNNLNRSRNHDHAHHKSHA